MHCRAEPVDVEDATAIAAVATASTAVAATPLPALEDDPTDSLLTSGSGLREAVIIANATPAEMIPVPLSEQHAVAMPGPGVNSASLEKQADPITASTVADATDAAADATMTDRQTPIVTSVAVAETATSVVAASTAETVVMESGEEVATVSTSAVAAARTVATAVVEERCSAASDTESASVDLRTESISEVAFVSTAAAATTVVETSDGSVRMSSSAEVTMAAKSQVLQLRHVHATKDESEADSVTESGAESSVSSFSLEQIKAHRSAPSEQPDLVSQSSQDGMHSSEEKSGQDRFDLRSSGSGVPLLAKRPVSKLEQLHAALRDGL